MVDPAFMPLPPIDLLESTHIFPGPYLFKIVGTAGVLTEAALVAALEPHAKGARVTGVKQSASGKHVSFTVEGRLVNAQAVHDALNALHKVEGVTMLL